MRKILPLALLLLFPVLSPVCRAQALGNAMLPEGSKDMYLGLALQVSHGVGDVDGRHGVLLPMLQVDWSNGIFLRGIGLAGIQLSQTPGINYGPLLQWQNGRSAADNPALVGSREIRPGPRLGGFFEYEHGAGLWLKTHALASADGAWAASLAWQKYLPQLAAHHSTSVSLGMTGANGRYMQKYYGVEGAYAPAGGLVNVAVSANWNWELSNSWLFSTELALARPGPAAANSPLEGQRSTLTLTGALGRRF